MNVVFKLPTPELDQKFISDAENAGMTTLKGHRSIGGVRASIYNAFPLQGVKDFVAFMQKFEDDNLVR